MYLCCVFDSIVNGVENGLFHLSVRCLIVVKVV